MVRVEPEALVLVDRAALGSEAEPLQQEEARGDELGGEDLGLHVGLHLNSHLVE